MSSSDTIRLSNLVRLNNDIWLSEGEERAKDINDGHAPQVILLFGWFAARLSHVVKYASHYRKSYPTSTIVIVQTSIKSLLVSNTQKRLLLKPLVDVLERKGIVGHTKTPSPPLLIHLFSTAGLLRLSMTTNLLAEKNTSSPPGLAASAIILDSSPGDTAFKPYSRAVIAAAPWYLKVPVFIVATSVWTTITLYDTLIATEPGHIPKARADLHDPKHFPRGAPRLYIYSKADEVIAHQKIEAHIAEARKLGLQVSVEVFEGTPHCAHAMSDGERYWTSVVDCWGRAKL